MDSERSAHQFHDALVSFAERRDITMKTRYIILIIVIIVLLAVVGIFIYERVHVSFHTDENGTSVSEILKSYTNEGKDKSRGIGVILCLIDKKTFLRENLVALPIEYI